MILYPCPIFPNFYNDRLRSVVNNEIQQTLMTYQIPIIFVKYKKLLIQKIIKIFRISIFSNESCFGQNGNPKFFRFLHFEGIRFDVVANKIISVRGYCFSYRTTCIFNKRYNFFSARIELQLTSDNEL